MQPFSNIRVLDLTHIIAGPFSTYQLGVLGAEVIKIEQPDAPDSCRQDGVDINQCRAGMGANFLAQNANKKSVAIDLKSDEGKMILRQLIETADVLVENYRSGALAKLGFGYDDVKEIQPDIIYCSLTGFGQEGPFGQRTAYDNVIQAISGLMATTGFAESGAVKVGPPVLDYGTGIQAAFAIAAALYQRTFTGEGQRIDISMLDAALMLSGTNVTHYQACGEVPTLHGNQSTMQPCYGCYDTADGQIMVGAYNSEQTYNAWRVMGDETHGSNLRHLPVFEMQPYVASDQQRIAEIMLTDTADNWETRFNAEKVPAARVRNVDETLDLEQLSTRGVLQAVEIDGESVALPAAAFTFAEGGPSLNSAPPYHGEHTREVLLDLGLSESELSDYDACGAIKAS